MPRYIDVDKLIAEYDRVHIGPAGGARKLMEDAPTADVAEVKHGEWKPEHETFLDDLGIESEPILTGWICSLCEVSEPCKSHYCPNCGAKMDGETE